MLELMYLFDFIPQEVMNEQNEHTAVRQLAAELS